MEFVGSDPLPTVIGLYTPRALTVMALWLGDTAIPPVVARGDHEAAQALRDELARRREALALYVQPGGPDGPVA